MGTVIDMTDTNRILDIDTHALTNPMQAGVGYLDAAKALGQNGEL